MKKILSVFLAVMLVCAIAAPAFAEELAGSDDWAVTYTKEGKLEDNFSGGDLAETIGGLQPGDTVTMTVTLVNNNEEEANFYMANEVVASLEEAGGEGGAYTYTLSYVGADGATTDIYNSDTIASETEEEEESSDALKEATSGLEEFFYLDSLTRGQKASVVLTVGLDGETEGNAYFNTAASLQMNFAVAPKSSNPNTGTSVGKVVQTGDDTNLFPFYVAMAVSGVLFLALAIDSVRRRRKEQEENA